MRVRIEVSYLAAHPPSTAEAAALEAGFAQVVERVLDGAALLPASTLEAFLKQEGIAFKRIDPPESYAVSGGKSSVLFMLKSPSGETCHVDSIYDAVDFIRNNAMRRL